MRVPNVVLSPLSDATNSNLHQSDGPDMLFARMADQGTGRSPQTQPQDDRRMLYLGEAFSLAFVVKTVCSPSGDNAEPRKVHYTVPSSVEDKSDGPGNQIGLDPDLTIFLQSQGSFNLPEKHICDEFVRIFFSCLHPAYPVLDRQLFDSQYRQGRVSLLLLQTIFFLSVIACDDQLVQRAGFENRYQAREVYYLRAKALYDADYEKDKTQLVAILFLLGFWWQKPQDQKDTWHWLGCAISLAQTMGMHRSTAHSELTSNSRSLWKRIWWSIYIRDRHAAAALGRPCRIRDEDCTVEPLEESDLETDLVSDPLYICNQQRYHVSYAIELAKLSVLLGRVLSAKYCASPSAPGPDDSVILASLDQWQRNLPYNMLRQPLSRSLDAAFWSSMLFACYHNSKILLCRPLCLVLNSLHEAENDEQARRAADETARIAEDLLASGTLRKGQLHLVPAFFAALGMHAIVIRRNDPVQCLLAKNRSRQCMLGLSELSKGWPVAGWILRLFISLMLRLTGRDFELDLSTKLQSSKTESGSSRVNSTSIQPHPRMNMLQHKSSDGIPPQLPDTGPQFPNQVGGNSAQLVYDVYDSNLTGVPVWTGQDALDFDDIFGESFAWFGPHDFGSAIIP